MIGKYLSCSLLSICLKSFPAVEWAAFISRKPQPTAGLAFEDVRATYIIVMTGPGTAMLEFIDGARTLREVRAGPEALGLVSSSLFFSKGAGFVWRRWPLRCLFTVPYGSILNILIPRGEKGTLQGFLKRNNPGVLADKKRVKLAKWSGHRGRWFLVWWGA